MKKHQDTGNKPTIKKKNTGYLRKSDNMEDRRAEGASRKLIEATNRLRSPVPSNPSKIKRR